MIIALLAQYSAIRHHFTMGERTFCSIIAAVDFTSLKITLACTCARAKIGGLILLALRKVCIACHLPHSLDTIICFPRLLIFPKVSAQSSQMSHIARHSSLHLSFDDACMVHVLHVWNGEGVGADCFFAKSGLLAQIASRDSSLLSLFFRTGPRLQLVLLQDIGAKLL